MLARWMFEPKRNSIRKQYLLIQLRLAERQMRKKDKARIDRSSQSAYINTRLRKYFSHFLSTAYGNDERVSVRNWFFCEKFYSNNFFLLFSIVVFSIDTRYNFLFFSFSFSFSGIFNALNQDVLFYH